MTEEKDFQTIATEHGKSCVEDCRQQLDVLATAENEQERLEELREERAALVAVREAIHAQIYGVSLPVDSPLFDQRDDADAAITDFDASEDGQELAKLESLADCDGFGDEDAARQIIDERPLSVQVRCPWQSVGEEGVKPDEYMILLGTGGPASRIIGELDDHGRPSTARYEYQDWFKPWTAARLSSDEEETLREWAAQFWFGD